MIEPARLALVCVLTEAGTYRVGTGYAVTPDLVLVALHVWRGKSGQVRFARGTNSGEWLDVEAAWVSSDEDDSCLLRLVAGPRSLGRNPKPLSFGVYDRSAPLACESTGYPAASEVALEQASTLRDTAGAQGMLDPGDALHRDLYGVTVAGAPGAAEAWPGMSGAPVLAENHLIGLVREVPRGFAGERLYVTPVARLLKSPEFARLLGDPVPRLVPLSALSPNLSGTAISSRALPNPASLLHARNRVVPFFAASRQAERTELATWLEEPATPSIRLFTGPGGAGKTRLFIEECERLRRQGWDAGFLGHEEGGPASDLTAGLAAIDALLARPRSTLVVIDYAETLPRLFELLRHVVRAEIASDRCYIALLARNAGDWWQVLGQRDGDLGDFLALYPPLALAPVDVAGDLRARAFAEAFAAFAAARGKTDQKLPAHLDLDDDRFARMLYIHMAALAAVEGLDARAEGLLGRMLDREQRSWERWLEESQRSDWKVEDFALQAGRAIAAITLLVGATSEAEARALVARAGGPDPDFVRFARRLYPAQPGSRSAYASGLEPDLLGEGLIVRVLERSDTPPDWLEKVCDGVPPAALCGAFTVLGRIAGEQPDKARGWIARILGRDVPGRAEAAFEAALTVGKVSAHSPLGQILEASLRQAGTVELARRLADKLPDHTVGLREVAVWVGETLLAALPEGEDPGGERARLLHKLGKRYSDLGQHEKALEAASQAVAAYRTLASATPAVFEAELARSLNNLGGMHGWLGQRERALEVTAEAVARYRVLASAQPALRRELARGLNNLGVMHGGLGRYEEALAATNEAVATYRALGTSQPDVLCDLAASLINLGVPCRGLGQPGPAMDAAREAVAILTELARERPDAYEPDLARSLANLTVRHSELGELDKALEATREEVAIWRKLAGARPDAFLGDLARALHNLGTWQSALGQAGPAQAAMREAVTIRRALYQARPDAFAADLAESLTNLAAWNETPEQRQEGLAALTEAVAIQRALASTQPEAFEPALALGLNNLGMCHGQLGQHEQAVTVTREALGLYSKLFRDRPAVFVADLDWCLKSLAWHLQALGRDAAADADVAAALALLASIATG